MRRLGAAYLVVQAALAVAWWAALATSDTVRERFELDPSRPEVLDTFLVADLVVFVAGSLVASWALAGAWRSAPTLVAVVAGGAAYATLYLVGWVALGGDGATGIAPMVAATTVTSTIAVAAWRAR